MSKIEDKVYSANRSDDCFFFRNATDKPIEMAFHHYMKQVVIINEETGMF